MEGFLKEYGNKIDNFIIEYLDWYFEGKELSDSLLIFKEAIYYALKWGKRIRAILALELYLSEKGITVDDLTINDSVVKYAIALECIHAYSLVHDDLPCMDDDTLRRGEATCWKKYWEYTATLVWDALNTLAFEVLSEIEDKDLAVKLVKILASASWTFGMVWGQMEDLYSEEQNKWLSLDALKSMHSKKTGALIKASVVGWAMISWISDLKSLWGYATRIWYAFQIKDDILDVEGKVEETGKSVWWENKWYVYHFGLEEAKKTLDELVSESLQLVDFLASDKLNFLTKYIALRKK